MNEVILYEAEVTDLKLKYRKRRMMIFISYQTFEVISLFFLYMFVGLFAFILFLVLAVFFLPPPIFSIPDEYKITEKGVIHRGGLPFLGGSKPRLFRLKRGYKLKMNEEERFVSVLHPYRSELIRLYTHEPEKVHNLLQNLITSLQITSKPKNEPSNN